MNCTRFFWLNENRKLKRKIYKLEVSWVNGLVYNMAPFRRRTYATPLNFAASFTKKGFIKNGSLMTRMSGYNQEKKNKETDMLKNFIKRNGETFVKLNFAVSNSSQS